MHIFVPNLVNLAERTVDKLVWFLRIDTNSGNEKADLIIFRLKMDMAFQITQFLILFSSRINR